MRDKNLLLALIAAGMLVLAAGMVALAVTTDQQAEIPAAEAALTPTRGRMATARPRTLTLTTRPPTALPTLTGTPSPTTLPTVGAAGNAVAAAPLPPRTPSATPTATSLPLGEVRASLAPPTYLAEGRWAEVMATVRNVSVPTGIATGYTYLAPNPDGGTQYVTAFGVDHQEVPQAKIDDGAPLWRGHVQFSDGATYWFPAGCFYIETIDAEGWEPIGGSDGFSWEVHWTGGFFDCGNSTHKIPPQPLLMPGEEATIPLYVYLQHPRLWEDPDWGPPDRAIVYVGLEVFDGLGRSLGIVAELDWR